MSKKNRFFFQAEDGIRDTSVTGVQTCALPISPTCATCSSFVTSSPRSSWSGGTSPRSEERRVGKECRARRTAYGEGAKRARVMLVGEEPGDKEDVAGLRFVGPA